MVKLMKVQRCPSMFDQSGPIYMENALLTFKRAYNIDEVSKQLLCGTYRFSSVSRSGL